MRKRIFVPLVIGILVLIGFFLWRNPFVEEESLRSENGQRDVAAENGSASNANAGHADNAAPPANQNRKLNRIEQLAFAVKQATHPIRFYGRIIDQNNEPVSGGQIKVTYTVESLISIGAGGIAEDNRPLNLVSDANGYFEVTGVTGSRLGLREISKPGYQLSSRVSHSALDSAVDPASPIIFRMWKRQGADRLVGADKFYGLVPDGRIYTLDFLKHKKVEGDQAEGDLRVWIKRSEPTEKKGKFEWSFAMDAIGGGVIESTDEFMNLAPEAGYQSHYEMRMETTDPNWWPRVKKQFHLKSRNGIYSRLDVEVIPDYTEKGIFSVKYFVNPTGSRNLEYDSRQLISTDNYFPPE